MERHVSLDLKLEKANEWALYGTLCNLEIPERLKLLEECLLEHARHHDDLGSNKFVEYVMAAVTDRELLPFVEGVDRDGGTSLILDRNKWKEVEEASRTASINRARKATELFARLPVSRPVNRLVFDQDSGAERRSVSEESTLAKTKESLLLEVANRWRATRSDEEADEFFGFIIEARLHYEDEQVRAGVLRKVTDFGFPTHRLIRAITQFRHKFRDRDGKILEILAHGLVKCFQQSMTDLVSVFYVYEPLSRPATDRFSSDTSSVEAHNFVQRAAEHIKAVDDKVRRMLTKIGSHGCSIEYPEQNGKTVSTVNLVCHERIPDVNFGHASFEHKRDEIIRWLRENTQDMRLRVNLKYIGKDSVSQVLVEREEVILY